MITVHAKAISNHIATFATNPNILSNNRSNIPNQYVQSIIQ